MSDQDGDEIGACHEEDTGQLEAPEASGDDADQEIIRLLPSGFSVNNEETANWVVRRIQEARAYKARVADWAERERRRAEQLEERILYVLGGQLRTWAMCQIGRERGKRKSVNLPAGTIGFRTTAPMLVIDDVETVLAWAKKSCPKAVIVSEKLGKAALLGHLKSTGELPPKGAHMEPAHQKFYVA